MKKLLSLLSVLTISGSTVPTTVAASPYQKEEQIKLENNKINYLETSKLNRNKRADEQECTVDFTIAPTLHVEWNQSQSYFAWIQRMIRYLNSNNTNIITNINNLIDVSQINQTYVLTGSSKINYFFIPIELNNSRDLYLVINPNNLYLIGFINNANRQQPTYYAFNDSSNTNPNNINFRGINLSRTNTGIDVNYSILWPLSTRLEFSQNLLTSSFNDLISYSGKKSSINEESVARIIFMTAEALRFNEISQLIGNSIIFHNVYNENGQLTPRDENSVAFDRAENNGRRFGYLNQWSTDSENYLDLSDFQRNNLRILNLSFLTTIRRNNNSCLPNRRSERSTENNECYGKNFYFNIDKSDKEFTFSYGTGENGTENHQITINLGEINPINFEKISFIGDTKTHSSWGDDSYYGTKISDFFNSKNIKTIIKNKKVIDNYSENEDNATYELQRTKARDGLAGVDFYQYIGLTFYWENGNYYLQILVHQRANTWATATRGAMWLKIGKGITLYNN